MRGKVGKSNKEGEEETGKREEKTGEWRGKDR